MSSSVSPSESVSQVVLSTPSSQRSSKSLKSWTWDWFDVRKDSKGVDKCFCTVKLSMKNAGLQECGHSSSYNKRNNSTSNMAYHLKNAHGKLPPADLFRSKGSFTLTNWLKNEDLPEVKLQPSLNLPFLSLGIKIKLINSLILSFHKAPTLDKRID